MDNVKGMFPAPGLLKRGGRSNNRQIQEKGIALKRPRVRPCYGRLPRERERERNDGERERSKQEGLRVVFGRKLRGKVFGNHFKEHFPPTIGIIFA